MSPDVSIRVAGLSKAYRIYAQPTDRLKQAVMPRLRRIAAPLLRALGRRVEAPAYFREFWALRELSFEVARGETIGIIGRNGSGKSTLLQLVCGTLSPSQGEVAVQGRVAALLELGSGFNPEYTGRQNVFLNASVLGLSQSETAARLPDILAFADIGDFIDQPVKTYSSGMAMRLAFAVIAHVDADVLIVDEALAVGDAAFQQKCFRWLRAFQHRGTLLFCGHDPAAVINLCQRAIWLDRGSVRLMGASKDVVEAYGAFVAAETMGLPETSVRVGAGAQGGQEDPAEGTLLQDGMQATMGTEIRTSPELAGYGTGAAEIIAFGLLQPDGTPTRLIRGGEDLALALQVRALQDIDQPIFGFQIKDRLGQVLLGGNSLDTSIVAPAELLRGTTVTARFTFRLPLLASGRYSVTLAVASGMADVHVQHHWIHDALFFDVHAKQQIGALIGADLRAFSVTEVKDPA
ncbi:ABC transporter ATP-binding protein [Roseococcus sp.]|uniref:ABC transporter ATP-binding protein n=1 Tax=Roseococcus sp. TaxID=2109646 RepID=UPI003BABDAA7